MSEYFGLLELKGMPVNVVQTVGHTQVRRIVMGDVDRRPNDEELEAMQDAGARRDGGGCDRSLDGLIYPPAVYAQTREIAALCSVAGEHGGRYYTHMRNEGDLLLEAIDEAIEIGREANTPGSHFSPEGGRPAELGKDAASNRSHQSGPGRRASRSRPTSIPTSTTDWASPR